MSIPAIATHIDRASFGLWTKDEIKKISVKKVTEPKSFEKAGSLHPDGLYSNTLGPTKRFDVCSTCGLTDIGCPGHFGHIELCVPVYHPMLLQVMYQLLSKCCLECFHFRLSQPSLKLFLAQLDALNCGFDHLIEELDDIAADMCRDNASCDNDSYLHVTLGNRLVSRIQEEKEKTPNFEFIKRPQQRSIVERYSKLFRNFINGHLIKPMKICPNCSEKKVTLSLIQQTVITIGTQKLSEDEKKVKKRANLRGKRVSESEKKRIKFDHNLRNLHTDEKRFLTPIGARYFLRKLWQNEKRNLQRIFHFLDIKVSKEELLAEPKEELGENFTLSPKKQLKLESEFQPVDLFFIDTILVPPSKFRPPMSQRGYSFEGPRTAALAAVMKQSVVVQDLIDQLLKEKDEIEAEKLQPKLQSNWRSLQIAVNSLYDNELDKYGKNKYPGLKQLIDKKEGLFRKNMMGKRVNFAARSVISPDPNILVDQIGVPLVFAKKLTYPQPVTPWNIQQMREAILNGPHNYPGATSIVYDDGRTVSLTKESVRLAIASRLSYNPRFRKGNNNDTHQGTIVNRHLVTGDVLLFNRQPTLHKPSIMAFRARVLPGEKGFRLHYANCKSFNADFDGDEMNAHLPQSELARSEAYNIASVNRQYLVPKDGSPLGGLIQDHVVAVCLMTGRDRFFDQEKFNQLVYCALYFLSKPLKLEPPAIVKPIPLWTGKQIITTIIKNCIPEDKDPLSLNIKSKIGPKILNISSEFEDLSDCNVVIRKGELLKGFMDKTNVGATQYGLIHTCYELYGGETSSNLMSAFARLATWYLALHEGFTLGIADILIEDHINDERHESIQASLTVGPTSAKEALGITGEILEEELDRKLREAHSDRNPLPMKKLDAAMKTRTDKVASEISSRCLPNGLIRRFPDNNLQMMIQSGAKGGTVNALQISCLLGQIELEGRRVPLSMSGRSLPSFRPYDTSPKAGGFVSGRFLTGIQPQEFFFHCMAGREGLIDTAVKTSRSGYLQRCLIKHLEGLTVQYDQTVRDSCGSVIQFLYGEDGLDIVKSQMLKDKAFASLVENHKIISPSKEELAILNKAKEEYEDEIIARTNEIQQWIENNGTNRIKNLRGSGFLEFLSSRLKDQSGVRVKVEVKEELHSDPDEIVERSDSPDIVELTKKKDESVIEKKKLGLEGSQSSQNYISSSQSKLITSDFKIGSRLHAQIFNDWYSLSFKEKKKWNKNWELCPDPLTSVMNPASHFGVVPEKFDERIEHFVRLNPHLVIDSARLLGASGDELDLEAAIACDENPELSKSILTHWNRSVNRANRPKLTKHEFYNLCYNLYLKMLAEPGEAVGLLAAQSIGEPSTQMTLNTFHFAGRGEMNVTLGIPRLREILMTASAKIGTPSMDLPLLPVLRDESGRELNGDEAEEQAKRVKLALNAVRLSDVLEYVDITEQVIGDAYSSEKAIQGRSESMARRSQKRSKPGDNSKGNKSVQYKLHFVLLPSKYYKHEFKSNSSKVMKFIEEVFISQLTDSMIKRQKRLLLADEMFDLSTKKMNTKERSTKVGSGQNSPDSDAEEENLDDFNAKAKAKDKVKEDESSSDEDDEGDGDNTAQRMKSRRDQDLDYEEPEDDDLEVGDMEAKMADDEERDKELLLDDESKLPEDGDSDLNKDQQMEKFEARKRKIKKESSTPMDDLEAVGEDDEATTKFKQTIEIDQELDERPAGDNCELASFDLDGNNSRMVSPAHQAGEDVESEQVQQLKEPSRKKKKVIVNEDGTSVEVSGKIDPATVLLRTNQIKSKPYVVDYEFDTKHERWCELTLRIELTTTRLDMGALVESEAKRTYVHRVGNIHRALIVKDMQAKSRGAICDKMIKTEGVSLLSLVRFNHILDLNAIYSNDIHAIANTYGIEAASQAIRREMANVFAVYGIEVDPHHLSLIADYMTYNGTIRGMNRMSMEASASPFQQMSYESTIRYLKWAAILGLYDDIKSPSAALVFGKPTRGGTGLFTMMADQNEKNEECDIKW